MTEPDLTVSILAGGGSTRFESNKALAEFRGKPLIVHMLEKARLLSGKILVVVSDKEQRNVLRGYTDEAEIVLDPVDSPRCALTGAITAFEFTETKHTQLLPVDTPLASMAVLQNISGLADNHGAVVPTWPEGHIEPLHSVFLAEHAYFHGLRIAKEGKMKMRHLIDSLSNVIGVSTEVLKKFDPELLTFRNINTEQELKDLERLKI